MWIRTRTHTPTQEQLIYCLFIYRAKWESKWKWCYEIVLLSVHISNDLCAYKSKCFVELGRMMISAGWCWVKSVRSNITLMLFIVTNVNLWYNHPSRADSNRERFRHFSKHQMDDVNVKILNNEWHKDFPISIFQRKLLVSLQSLLGSRTISKLFGMCNMKSTCNFHRIASYELVWL